MVSILYIVRIAYPWGVQNYLLGSIYSYLFLSCYYIFRYYSIDLYTLIYKQKIYRREIFINRIYIDI